MKFNSLRELQQLKFRQIFMDGIKRRLVAPGRIGEATNLHDYLHNFLSEMNPKVPKEWEEEIKKVL